MAGLEAALDAAHSGPGAILLVRGMDRHKRPKSALRPTVLRELRRSGVREDLLPGAVVTVESQETVDRDFEGSWPSP
jgi:hypothetical protein